MLDNTQIPTYMKLWLFLKFFPSYIHSKMLSDNEMIPLKEVAKILYVKECIQKLRRMSYAR